MSRKAKRPTTSQGGESSGRPEKKQGYATSTQPQTRGNNAGSRGGHLLTPRQGGSRAAGTSAQTIPQCTHCGRRHPGECRLLTEACLVCGDQGHFIRDCPNRREVSAAASELTV